MVHRPLIFSNMMLNNWEHKFPIWLENHFHFLQFSFSYWEILAILSFPQNFFFFVWQIFSIFCDLIFIFHLGASPSDSNKWTHFQKCIQFRRSRALLPLLSLQISKYYNHYQIGEFPLLVFAQCYQTKSFITFESKMSLPFLSTLGPRLYLSIDTIYLDTYDLFVNCTSRKCV